MSIHAIYNENELIESIKMNQVETGRAFQEFAHGHGKVRIGWDGCNVLVHDNEGPQPVDPAQLLPVATLN